MPIVDSDFPYDVDLDKHGSRFSRTPAVAIAVGDFTDDDDAEATVRDRFGDWVLDETQPELGIAEAHDASFGRGAEAWGAVAEFVAVHAAGGVISVG